jgi:hypothetical protein
MDAEAALVRLPIPQGSEGLAEWLSEELRFREGWEKAPTIVLPPTGDLEVPFGQLASRLRERKSARYRSF